MLEKISHLIDSEKRVRLYDLWITIIKHPCLSEEHEVTICLERQCSSCCLYLVGDQGDSDWPKEDTSGHLQRLTLR